MDISVAKMLSISSDPLLTQWSEQEERFVLGYGRLGAELLELLRHKNGFIAFESALHVFPLGCVPDRLNLQSWNNPLTWSGEYGDLLPKSCLFFAQDAFGEQFCLNGNSISRLTTEQAKLEHMASTVSEWCECFMNDWNFHSGYRLAHDWQVLNRPLVEGERLIPKTPFALGGAYEVDNLYAGRIVDAMRFRAHLARQISTLPDGAAVRFKITD